MSVFGSNEELVDKIKSQISTLKSSALEPREFETLLENTRELYERMLILRYKAFEQHTGKQEETQTPIEPESSAPEQKEVEEEIIIPQVETPEKETEPFTFSLFEEIEEEQTKAKNTVSETSEVESDSQPEEQITGDSRQPETFLTNQSPVSESAKEPESLLERLSEQSNSNRLADKLKLTRIDSLGSTFTLNDRIRFSQGLFSGNNEAFRNAVQELDSSASRDIAIGLLKKYEAEYSWDMESKDVEHFYEFVERLYV